MYPTFTANQRIPLYAQGLIITRIPTKLTMHTFLYTMLPAQTHQWNSRPTVALTQKV